MKKQLKMFAASFLMAGALAITPLAQSNDTEYCKLSLKGCGQPVTKPAAAPTANNAWWLTLLSAMKAI